MIDLKAARHDPDGYRAALARKGAGEAFDAVLEADERWRALVPKIDELRGKTKLKGKPSPEQLAEMQQVKEELRAAEEELAAAEAERDEALAQVPNPPHESASRTAWRRTTPSSSAARASLRRSWTPASTRRSAASTWSAQRGSPARASAT